MLKPTLAALALLLAGGAARASNCEEIQAEIAAKFRANGIGGTRLAIVDMDADVPGRVVGRCAQGSRKIVVVQAGVPEAGAAPREAAPPAPRRREVITECRDGTVVLRGDCPR
ncbi:DUF1161 domain-containing protein [Azohydromonas caseinilytica]|uniref:DUF1161 domain-containing protein n=1 Tax=Azohydromonas caseinilytica TaxID=2728836 RepID=A0A848FAM4_9BURK|nr:DUF1161 domain-containing protein [Azohydromonas caseinilytica]NML17237.1 DUF1161 domain-containing protein [Azohydromonas caseinilytica]